MSKVSHQNTAVISSHPKLSSEEIIQKEVPNNERRNEHFMEVIRKLR